MSCVVCLLIGPLISAKTVYEFRLRDTYLFEEFDEEMEADQDGGTEEIDGYPSEDTDEETSKFFPIHEPGNMLGQGTRKGRGGFKVALLMRK